MKQHYMTRDERLQLEAYRRAGKGVSWISREMGFCRQTIYNELRRGSYDHLLHDWRQERRYSAEKGQQISARCQRNKGRPAKLSADPHYRQFLEDRLTGVQPDGKRDKKKRCSPAVALELARRQGFTISVCVGTLYRYIYQGRMGKAKACDLWEAPYRREQKEDEDGKGRIAHPKLPSIEQRPGRINDREEPGHWEMDLIVGKSGTKAVLLTLTERVSRQELIFKLPDRKAATIRQVFDKLEQRSDFRQRFRSITTDNGSEFLEYEKLVRSIHGGKRFDLYYCHSYSAWEKGSVENHNRMIRRFIPKGSDIGKISEKRVAEIQNWMNNYPRKILNWATPAEYSA